MNIGNGFCIVRSAELEIIKRAVYLAFWMLPSEPVDGGLNGDEYSDALGEIAECHAELNLSSELLSQMIEGSR